MANACIAQYSYYKSHDTLYIGSLLCACVKTPAETMAGKRSDFQAERIIISAIYLTIVVLLPKAFCAAYRVFKFYGIYHELLLFWGGFVEFAMDDNWDICNQNIVLFCPSIECLQNIASDSPLAATYYYVG